MKAREPRVDANVAARMRVGTDWIDVSIKNLSSRGLMAKSTIEVAQRTYVELHRGSQIIVGRVVWSRGAYFGLRTQDKIDILGLIGEARAAASRARTDDSTGWPERRLKPRHDAPQAAAYRAERSRALANGFQFLAIGAVGALACVFAALAVGHVLKGAFAPALTALGG